MVHDNILDNTQSEELIIDGPIRGFLAESARWAKFLAIIAFVMLGLVVLMLIIGGGLLTSTLGEFGLFGGFGILFYVLLLGVSAIPIVYLYQFATKMQLALANDDQVYLQEAFSNHKSMFKFYGIMMAIFLGFYALLIVGSLFFGLAATAF